MKSDVAKRSIVIARHTTSVRRGVVSQQPTKEMTRESALSDLVGELNLAHRTNNLTSAPSVFALEYFRMQSISQPNVREPNRSRAFYSLEGTSA
jgi:predicted DNA-binding ribbon-helix-helix protein